MNNNILLYILVTVLIIKVVLYLVLLISNLRDSLFKEEVTVEQLIKERKSISWVSFISDAIMISTLFFIH